jgi:predicted O-linked N-acetylglucosamine transferase (SPINDLY family)
LVFAPRAELSVYLARLRLADLFLDTWPYNAGATANDALFAGLPLLTRAGDTMASRVAASQLRTMGVPELVTYDSGDYERMAIELARAPERLEALRARLRVQLSAFAALRHAALRARLRGRACGRMGRAPAQD